MDRPDTPLSLHGPPARTFGNPPPGIRSPSTVTVHAIVVDGDRVLVVDDHQRCALPGGVLADAKQPSAWLTRMVRDAAGVNPTHLRVFQRAHHWPAAPAPEGRRRSRPDDGRDCWFYVAELPGGTALPAGGSVRWAPRDAALDLLDDPASRWALSVALCADAVLEVLGAHTSPAA